MRICRLTPDRLNQFLQFNQAINPTRNDVVERFEFLVLENPLLTDKTKPDILVAYDDDGQIVGQHLHNPFEYYHRGKKATGYYGFDFFVPGNYRNQGIGAAIARQAKADFYPHFGVGVSEVSQRIQLSLGNRIIGHLFAYIWIRNVLSPIKFGLNKIRKKKSLNRASKLKRVNLPPNIGSGEFQFKRVASLSRWDYGYWNHEILEFSRSYDFINWRFLSKKDIYSFYLLDQPDSLIYFVVRKIFARGLNLLALVDYRLPDEDEEKLKSVLGAAKKLAKLGGFDGIFTMSSHRFFDENLKSSSFLKVGNPIVMLTNADLDLDTEKMNERKAVLATMADSDLDLYFEFC